MAVSTSVNPPFLGLDPTKFTSEITVVRLMSDMSLEMLSITLASLGLFLFGS